MKRLFHLVALVTIAALFAAGCQKYDDSDLREQLQELREKLASLEAWCSSSQSAIDAVAVLQKAVENMNSVESIDPFIDADGATVSMEIKYGDNNIPAGWSVNSVAPAATKRN